MGLPFGEQDSGEAGNRGAEKTKGAEKERGGNTRASYLPPEKSVCRSRSNS